MHLIFIREGDYFCSPDWINWEEFGFIRTKTDFGDNQRAQSLGYTTAARNLDNLGHFIIGAYIIQIEQ